MCLWAFAIQNALQACAAGAWVAFAVFRWPTGLDGFRPIDLVDGAGVWSARAAINAGWLLGVVWIAGGVWGAGAIAAFWWADFGPEERWRELWIGCSIAPRIFATNTLEDFTGFKRGGYVEDNALEAAWNSDKFLIDPARPYEGQPGSGRFDVLQPSDVTWAVRLHHRYVRPWARRRGWVTG